MSITVFQPSAAILWLIIALLCAIMQYVARRGFSMPVRRIEALDRIDDMIGRATEMGGTVLMGTGYSRLNESGAAETMMAFSAVRYVAERTAKLGTRLLVTSGSPDHIPVLQDIVQQAARIAGNPDYYKGGGEIVRQIGADGASFITQTLFLLTPQSGINAKALIGFGDSGGYSWCGPSVGMVANINGVVSLSGTANVHQIHNFVAAFDYAVIGDEVYALSAYLTREPTQLGTLMGLDYSKMIIIALLFIGSIYAAATGNLLFT